MRYKNFLIITILFFLNKSGIAGSFNITVINCPGIEIVDTTNYSENQGEILMQDRPNPILKFFRAKQQKKKRVIAVLLAFPLPFGIVGLHRIYLGCAPYVPVAYIASLGGMFGVLPFIDFCVLLLNKDTESYSDNKKIFMWVN